MCPLKYELGFYIPQDDILHSHRRENLKSYTFIVADIHNGLLINGKQTRHLPMRDVMAPTTLETSI
jgi:hypothetical protein